MGFITGLPKFKNGYDALMVIFDKFTRAILSASYPMLLF
jgi:hypothetical protein